MEKKRPVNKSDVYISKIFSFLGCNDNFSVWE